MKHWTVFHIATAAFLLLIGLLPPAHAAPTAPDEGLSVAAAPCRTLSAPPPRLPVRVEYDGAEVLRYDFNGDGWCDFAYAVSYPFNRKMNSYELDQQAWREQLMTANDSLEFESGEPF